MLAGHCLRPLTMSSCGMRRWHVRCHGSDGRRPGIHSTELAYFAIHLNSCILLVHSVCCTFECHTQPCVRVVSVSGRFLATAEMGLKLGIIAVSSLSMSLFTRRPCHGLPSVDREYRGYSIRMVNRRWRVRRRWWRRRRGRGGKGPHARAGGDPAVRLAGAAGAAKGAASAAIRLQCECRRRRASGRRRRRRGPGRRWRWRRGGHR